MTTATPARPAAPPRRSALDRATAMTLAATEYDRFGALLASLSPQQWSTPTCCTGWDVRAMAGHLLGMAEMAAGMRENFRQVNKAKRRVTETGEEYIDALNAMQVDEHAGLTPQEVTDRYRALAPKAVRGRRRTPWLARRMTPPELRFAVNDGVVEQWTVGFIIDTILTRDPWLHRADIAAATGVPMHLTAEHDGAIVADVVGEWASRHGQPVTLHLTGPAGGSWSFGAGPRLELDALDFCRYLSGRAVGEGLLTTQVPF